MARKPEPNDFIHRGYGEVNRMTGERQFEVIRRSFPSGAAVYTIHNTVTGKQIVRVTVSDRVNNNFCEW